MKIIKRSVQIIFLVTLVLLTTFLIAELRIRNSFTYNEAGRYFDEDSTLVYHEQALPFYWVFLLIVAILSGFTIRWMLKTK